MLATIAEMWGASLGACAITVVSRLHTSRPAALASAGDVPQQHAAVDAFPARVRVGEMLADVADRQRAEYGVADRMQQRIRVGMSVESALERNGHAAQDELAPFDQRMDIEAVSDPHRHAVFSCAASIAAASARSPG